jgi:RNA polymerase sigma-70 factor (ECF subfamily)
MAVDDVEFDRFVERAEPELRRALSGHLLAGAVPDAVGEALAYAWENRERVLAMSSPVGYLYRVAQSRSRRRREGFLVWPGDGVVPWVEPGLAPALARLPRRQARVVWLVHGCGWSHAEVGEALGISASTVATHGSRGLAALRTELGVIVDG